MEGFTYVVNPPVIPRVAFGSGLKREVLPLCGPSYTSFMRRQMGEMLVSPPPTARADERDYFDIKYPSKIGYSAFASKLPRLPATVVSRFPSVGAYDTEPKRPQEPAYMPFNTGAKRAELRKFMTPPPNSYIRQIIKPQRLVNMAFGTQRKHIPVVQILCSPYNVSQCHKCHCTPEGDYWHSYEDDLDLCRKCKRKLERKLKSCTVTEVERLQLRRILLPYRLVRYCGFFHDHKGTTAATQIITTKTLKFKIKKENYLSMYM